MKFEILGVGCGATGLRSGTCDLNVYAVGPKKHSEKNDGGERNAKKPKKYDPESTFAAPQDYGGGETKSLTAAQSKSRCAKFCPTLIDAPPLPVAASTGFPGVTGSKLYAIKTVRNCVFRQDKA
jgi:hypothetical protein